MRPVTEELGTIPIGSLLYQVYHFTYPTTRPVGSSFLLFHSSHTHSCNPSKSTQLTQLNTIYSNFQISTKLSTYIVSIFFILSSVQVPNFSHVQVYALDAPEELGGKEKRIADLVIGNSAV